MLNNELEGTFHDPKKTIAESKVYFVNIFFSFRKFKFGMC